MKHLCFIKKRNVLFSYHLFTHTVDIKCYFRNKNEYENLNLLYALVYPLREKEQLVIVVFTCLLPLTKYFRI